MFTCDKCGACCRNIDVSPIYAGLDSGNGICKYLVGNLCSIYEKRPLLCRVDESYDIYFKNTMTRIEYERLNYESCIKLKKV